MIKIAHIADVHLRDRQYAYSSRGDDFSEALRSAVRTAIANNANAVICAGDLLDNSHPSASVVVGCLTSVHDLLTAAGIPMYVISGNHDKTAVPWTEIFSAVSQNENSGIICLDNKEATVGGITILGIPFMSNEEMREKLKLLREGNKYYDILTWHGALQEFTGYPSPGSLCVSEFEGIARVVALGDQHIHKKLEVGNTLAAYPGSTELCDESENENKALIMYSWDEHTLVSVESISFPTKPVQRFLLKTELDVEEAITQIKSDSLVFVKYSQDLENVIPRLNSVLTPHNILRPAALPSNNKIDAVGVGAAKETLKNPVDFVTDNLGKVVPKDKVNEVKDLCVAMVDSSMDHRYAIDKYCADRMEGKIIL